MQSNELYNRVRGILDEIPIVDPHTHLRCDQMIAPDAAYLMSYHWVKSELDSVGMPPELFSENLSSEERLRNVVPYFRRMRNTATAGCVERVFRELYGFHEELTEENWPKLFELSRASAAREGRAKEILVDLSGFEQLVTSVGNKSVDPEKNPDYMYYMMDLHYLFSPGQATDLLPWFAGRTTEDAYIPAIESLSGKEISDAKDLGDSIEQFLRRELCGKTRYTNCFLPIEFRFRQVSECEVNRVLQSRKAGVEPAGNDLQVLISYVTWKILEVLNDLENVLQIAVGAEYFICGGRSISRFEHDFFTDMVKVCYQFPKVKFDFVLASDVLQHELAVCAKMIKNVYCSGYWWHNYYPVTIRRMLEYRLEMVPLMKLGGFFCDAYYAEWSYAKLKMVKAATARVLADKVEEGVYSEEKVAQVARALFYDNPRSLYRLDL